MNAPDERARERQKLREQLRKAMADLGDLGGVYAADQYTKKVEIGKLRRRGGVPPRDPTRTLTLVENKEGVLLWEEGPVLSRSIPGLRRAYRAAAAQGDVVDHIVVEPLEPSQVGQALTWIDSKLTPKQGLRAWNGKNLGTPDDSVKPVPNGRILLFIHGTFSQSEAILGQLTGKGNKEGNALLARAGKTYDQILAFDHPTLSVSPMLNAVDLERRLEGSKADVDVVCHSRGGLVTRWWLEAFGHPVGQRRAVFVGSPLDGTSLAAPPRLRSVLSWFSNLNKALAKGAELGSSLIPFLSVISCLARFTATVTSLAAKTPVIDAAVAMIPGLAAMSRTSNNFELQRLNGSSGARENHFAIKSHFQPKDPGWKFWEYFVDQPLRRAAESLFPGENDLVVDTTSMTVVEAEPVQGSGRKLLEIPAKRLYDFGGTDSVHHTNYFLQTKTCEKIAEWLKIQ